MKCMAIFPLPYGHYNRKDSKDRGSGQVDFVFDLQLFAGDRLFEGNENDTILQWRLYV